MLPGWYGFGSAVDGYGCGKSGGPGHLQPHGQREWPFFRSLLSNMDMVLAKTDLAIASRYAELVSDAELRDEHLQPHQGRMGADPPHLLAILGTGRFLADNPLLKRSLQLRFPYMDPLNHLQVELLRATAPAKPTSACARHPPVDQRRRFGPAQQRVVPKR
jgi:phosphoenolpyruvate carboxylase